MIGGYGETQGSTGASATRWYMRISGFTVINDRF
jgi:hypothetical protein